MQLTKNRLRQIIKEELGRVLNEQADIGSLGVPTEPRRRPSPPPVEIPSGMTPDEPMKRRLGNVNFLLFSILAKQESRQGHAKDPLDGGWEDSVTKLVRDSIGANSTRVTFSVKNGKPDKGTIQIEGVPSLTSDQLSHVVQALNSHIRMTADRYGEVEDGVYFVDSGVPPQKYDYDERKRG